MGRFCCEERLLRRDLGNPGLIYINAGMPELADDTSAAPGGAARPLAKAFGVPAATEGHSNVTPAPTPSVPGDVSSGNDSDLAGGVSAHCID
jgi:hypothetical protein